MDIAAGNAHASFSVPAFLGLTGDLIQIGGTSYIKTSLTGDKYQSQKAAASLPRPTRRHRQPGRQRGRLPVEGRRGPGQGRRRRVRQHAVLHGQDRADARTSSIALGADGPAASGLPIDVGAASLNLTIRVEKDTNHLAGIAATVALGEQGSITLDMAMSKWDQPVTISAPPADQVQAAS